MNWDKAPKEPRPGELFAALGMPVVGGLVLSNHNVWWMWTIAAIVTVSSVFTTVRWVRENREYRAWVAWDEAGGPDAHSRKLT